MALELKDKRGNEHESEDKSRFNPFSDKKKGSSADPLEESFNADNSGYDPDNPASKAKNPAQAEDSTSVNDGQNSSVTDKEKGLLSGAAAAVDTVGKGFSVASPGKLAQLTGVVKNKRNLGIGGALAALLTVFIFFFLSLGPLKLVHLGTMLERFHFANGLNFTNDRVGLMRYFRSGADARTLRLGRTFTGLAEKWDIRMEANTGLRSVYSPGTKRFIGYEIVDADKAATYIDEFRNDGLNTNGRVPAGSYGVGAKNPLDAGGPFVDLRDQNPGSKRSIIRSIYKGLDVEDVPGSVAARLLIRYGGVDFSPLKNLARAAADNVVDWRLAAKQERAQRLAQGVDVEGVPRLSTDDSDGDGVPDESSGDAATDEAIREQGDLVDRLEGLDPTDPEAQVIKNQIKAEVGVKLNVASRAGKAATIVVGAVCATRAVGGAVEAKQYLNLVLPMLRLSTLYMSIASQIKSGSNLSSEEIAVYASDLFDPVSGLDVFSAAPLVALLGTTAGATGVPIPPETHPGQAGEKPKFFRLLDNSAIGAICGIESFINGLPVIKQIGDLSDRAINTILGAVGLAPDELIASLVSALAGSSINYYAVGAELGNYLMYGGRLASNMLGASTGAAPLSQAQEEQLVGYNNELLREENAEKSFFARMFDTDDADSLATKLAFAAPSTLPNLMSAPQQYAASLLNLSFLPTASASAATTFDYGFPAYGFSLAAQQNQAIQDPYANAEYVEENEKIKELDANFGDCFNQRINPETLDLENNDRDRMDVTDEKCHGDGGDILRYRMYLADRVNESALGCYEGVEESCDDVGFSANSTPASSLLNTQGLNGYVIPCEGLQRDVARINTPSSEHADWSGIPDSGTLVDSSGNPLTDSSGNPIKVYIRDSCDKTDVKTLLIVSSIHGSENGGQFVGHELLFNVDKESIPANVRIIVVPELNKTGIQDRDAGCVPRPTNAGYLNCGRVNANAVNLNRNFDYRWSTMDGVQDNNTLGSGNYRGTSPMSEPESVAISNFINSLGRIDLSIHYHDNLNYVASAGNALGSSFAQTYSSVTGMPLGNSGGSIIYQRGSLDGWQAETKQEPVLLVELGNDLSATIITQNVNAILEILEGL